MLTPSPQIIQLLAAFAPMFTKPTFGKVVVLLYGAILSPGKRTITAALRVLGLDLGREQTTNFGKYHRVLNQAVWSPMGLSRQLLHLLVTTFVAPGGPLIFIVDETLERRAGKRVVYKGWFRDAVRSVGNKVAVSLGIRWCVICLLVAVPWAKRSWALPFLCVPVLSEKTCKRLHKPHRSGIAWTVVLLKKLRRWYPDAEMTLIGDGAYASVELVAACQCLHVRLISRLRLDAQLYDFAGVQPKSKRGRKPQKGARLPSLATLLCASTTVWCQSTLPWYGAGKKSVNYCSGCCLWYTPGQSPVPLRWVLVRYEETSAKADKVKADKVKADKVKADKVKADKVKADKVKADKVKADKVKGAVFFCSDISACAEQILDGFVSRWNIEVTFEEVRAQLGFETQRHWSRRAIGRTTPCLLGLFSLVVLMAHRLHPTELPLQQADWYRKEEATFSDVLGAVRAHLWNAMKGSRMNYTHSPSEPELCLIPRALWRQLQQVACYAA